MVFTNEDLLKINELRMEYEGDVVYPLFDKVLLPECVVKVIDKYKKLDQRLYNYDRRISQLPASSDKKPKDPRDYDGVPILARSSDNENNPNNRIHYPFFNTIGTNKTGFLASDINVKVNADLVNDTTKDKEKQETATKVEAAIKSWRSNVNMQSIESNLMFKCATTGVGYILFYLDEWEEVKTLKVMEIDNWRSKVFYNDNKDPEMAVYYNRDKAVGGDINEMIIYTSQEIYNYKKVKNVWKCLFTINTLGVIPLIQYRNNGDGKGNAPLTLSQQDAYDRVVSNSSDEIEKLSLSYMILKNFDLNNKNVDEELTKGRVISVNENGGVEFLTKNINDTFLENHKKGIWNDCFMGANSFDPKAVGTNTGNKTAFEVSRQYSGFIEDANRTEKEWQFSFNQVNKILSQYIFLIAKVEYNPSSVKYIMARSGDIEKMNKLQIFLSSGGTLTNEVLGVYIGIDEFISKEDLRKAEEIKKVENNNEVVDNQG